MSLIEIDFQNETWPVVRDFISSKLYERFCNGKYANCIKHKINLCTNYF